MPDDARSEGGGTFWPPTPLRGGCVSSCKHWHVVAGEEVVLRDEHETLRERLRNQHPVKGIAVYRGQPCHSFGAAGPATLRPSAW